MAEIRQLSSMAVTKQTDLENDIIRSILNVYDGVTFMQRMVKAVNIAMSSRRYERDGTCNNTMTRTLLLIMFPF
jgi:hypothetical protein